MSAETPEDGAKLLFERFDPAELALFEDSWPEPEEHKRQVILARATKTRSRNEMRRVNSEAKLAQVLPMPFDQSAAYHVVSGGDIDSLSYLARVLAEAPMDYVLLSTWCMAMPDVETIERWLATGRIGRMDAYGGEIFPNQYPAVHQRFVAVLREYGGRMCIFRNHAKVFAGTGPLFDFAIETSANVNTNPRSEQATITFGREIFEFYKSFYDGIKSFNRDFDDWTPWKAHARSQAHTNDPQAGIGDAA